MSNSIQALKDNEARMRAIVDTVVDGIITISELGIIETVNPAVLDMFGYSEEDMVGQNVKMLMPEPYKKEHDGYLKHHHETGEKKVIGIGRQVQGQRKDGTIFPIDLAVNEMNVGGIKMFTGVVRDISERLEAESKQKDVENRTKAIVDTVVDGIVTISELGIIETVNPSVTRMFGYSEEEMVGQNIKMLMPEPYKDEHDGYLKHHHDTGEKKVIGIGRQVQGQRKDGTIFPIDLAVNEMHVGGIKMFTGVVRDISDRIAAESKQKDIENRTRAILDTVVDGIITIDKMGVIETVNPATLKVFGYSEEEMVGQNVKMLMPNPYKDEHDGYLKHHRVTGEKKVIGIGREVEGQRKDGSIFPLELAVSEMMINGQQCFTGIVRDITERKHAETLKEEFISTVSHELRTPLTSIRGSIGLLTGGLAGEFSDKARQLLTIAHNNTERLLMLINDILDLSKIESGKMDFKFAEMDVQSFLEEAIASNHGYAEQHGVSYVLENNVMGAKLHADENRLMQVMNNLMSNAAKFAPQGDKIVISVNRHHQQIRISVTDHGSGIPKELEPRIFDKFTQADSSDTRQVGGTGLGLNITKAMIEKHNGRIAFASEQGVGTTFYFDIPELITNEMPNNLKKLTNQPDMRILICEDEPDIASLLRLMLTQSGFESDIASTAKEAEELLSKNHYIAMTLDIMLPDKNGIDLYKDLRENSATKNMPIVFVSAKADQTKDSIEGRSFNGSVEWINKPVNADHLIEAIENGILKFQKNSNTQLVKRILHVEDDADISQLVRMLLDETYDITLAASLMEARAALTSDDYDLVLLDIGLPDGSGLDLIANIRKLSNPPEVIIFSADDMKIPQNSTVAESLVKSKTTNDELVKKIKEVITSV